MDININIPDVTCKEFPVKVKGHDEITDCVLVMSYPTNLQKYSMLSPKMSEGFKTLFLECFSEIRNPFKINQKEITAEDFIKYPMFSETFDEVFIWLAEALIEPEKN